jgi:hypothetical protein
VRFSLSFVQSSCTAPLYFEKGVPEPRLGDARRLADITVLAWKKRNLVY